MKIIIPLTPKTYKAPVVAPILRQGDCGHTQFICQECGEVNEVEPAVYKEFITVQQYTPKDYKEFQHEVRMAILGMPAFKRFEGKVKMGYEFVNPHVLCDLTNLEKGIEDCLQDKNMKVGGKNVMRPGLVFKNDNQIMEKMYSRKVFRKGEHPQIILQVEDL